SSPRWITSITVSTSPASAVRPVSSRSSRTAACATVSPGSMRPPGKPHLPAFGAFARCTSRTRPSRATTASTAGTGAASGCGISSVKEGPAPRCRMVTSSAARTSPSAEPEAPPPALAKKAAAPTGRRRMRGAPSGRREQRNDQQRDDVDDLDQRVDRRARGVLVRVADGVAGDRGLVGLGALAAEVAVLDVLLRVVPGAAAGRHRDRDEEARDDRAEQDSAERLGAEIGRASCRERVYVWVGVVSIGVKNDKIMVDERLKK